MKITARCRLPVQEAARSATMGRILLEEAGVAENLKKGLDGNILLHHLLMSMLRDAHIVCRCLGPNTINDHTDISRIRFRHRPVLYSCLGVRPVQAAPGKRV